MYSIWFHINNLGTKELPGPFYRLDKKNTVQFQRGLWQINLFLHSLTKDTSNYRKREKKIARTMKYEVQSEKKHRR